MELELRSVDVQGAHDVGASPHPREKGVGPLVFIFGEDFLLIILRYSVEFQVVPRTFIFCTHKKHHGNSSENNVSPG